MISKQIAVVRTISFLHALLSLYFLIFAILFVVPKFYIDHVFLHVVLTLVFFVTFIAQRIFRGCPITHIERKMLEKINQEEAMAFSNSFIVYKVKKITGITLPLRLVQSLAYIYLLLLIYSWLYLFIKI